MMVSHTQNCLTELAVEQPSRKQAKMRENFRQNGRRRLKMACTACAAVCMSLLLASKTSSTPVVLTPEEWPRALPGASGDGTSWVGLSTLPVTELRMKMGEERAVHVCCRMRLVSVFRLCTCSFCPFEGGTADHHHMLGRVSSAEESASTCTEM